jgi:5-methyltetrahydropteroyltriglutamate--homocysteine methyltransferase
VLQLDCPDLAFTRHRIGAESLEDFRRFVALHVDAIDHATRDIPPEDLRMHVCWGNYEGPHHHDVPLRDIVDIVLGGRPSAISFEAANPRHAHEWRVFEDVKLPEGKALIPGVIDSTTNYVEHPELVAERIARFARLVGRENVIAGTDCGFASFAGSGSVDPAIVWAKLAALGEGAGLASRELW